MTQRRTLPALLMASAALALVACGPRADETPADAVAVTPTAPEAAGPGRGWGDAPTTLAEMQARNDARFDAADADSDGVVTTAELKARADDRGGPGMREEGMREGGMHGGGRGLARADADGDGRITRDEARAQVAERFARMDANGDGTIGEDERPQRGEGRGGDSDGTRGGPPAQ